MQRQTVAAHGGNIRGNRHRHFEAFLGDDRREIAQHVVDDFANRDAVE